MRERLQGEVVARLVTLSTWRMPGAAEHEYHIHMLGGAKMPTTTRCASQVSSFMLEVAASDAAANELFFVEVAVL